MNPKALNRGTGRSIFRTGNAVPADGLSASSRTNSLVAQLPPTTLRRSLCELMGPRPATPAALQKPGNTWPESRFSIDRTTSAFLYFTSHIHSGNVYFIFNCVALGPAKR